MGLAGLILIGTNSSPLADPRRGSTYLGTQADTSTQEREPTEKEIKLAQLTANAINGSAPDQLALAIMLKGDARPGTILYSYAIGWLVMAIDQDYAPAIETAQQWGLPISQSLTPTPTVAAIPEQAEQKGATQAEHAPDHSGDMPPTLIAPVSD